MLARLNILKVPVAAFIVVAIMSVVIPVCLVVPCAAMPSGAMPHPIGVSVGPAACNAGSMTGTLSSGVFPTGSQSSLLLSLAALIGVALMVVVPPRRLNLVLEDPPDPPDISRGVRLNV